jgi:hypothetical protein
VKAASVRDPVEYLTAEHGTKCPEAADTHCDANAATDLAHLNTDTHTCGPTRQSCSRASDADCNLLHRPHDITSALVVVVGRTRDHRDLDTSRCPAYPSSVRRDLPPGRGTPHRRCFGILLCRIGLHELQAAPGVTTRSSSGLNDSIHRHRVYNLVEDRDVQLTLPFDAGAGPALDAALDTVRDRFGTGAVTRAALLGRRQGQSVPLLPD